jgi:hypothetical protein
MADLTNIFGGPFRPTPTRKKAPDIQLMNAMLEADLDPPEHLYLDGKIYRFGPKNSCWYVAFGDGVPAGRFGDWKLGLDVTWRAEVDRDLTDIDRMALSQRLTESRKLRDEEKAKRQEVASFAVDQIWAECIEASRDHPYLVAKGIEAHGTKVTGDGRIVVPIYDQFGDVASLQYITGEGEKKFHPGAKTGGCFWALGKPTRTIYICEGFATAATVYEATKTFTYVAFNAANIPSTVQFARSNHKGKIVIIADNDESGTGQRYADEAAKKYGATVVVPPELDTDANDFAQAGGDLRELLMPHTGKWLESFTEFVSQPAPLSWMVKGWVQDNALIMVHGPSGGGKTFVVLDWMLRVANHHPDWFGHKVRGGTVVYLAGEGHHGMRSRLAGWAQHHGAPKDDFYISQSGCDLNTPEGYQKVVDSLEDLESLPRVIVVDTLHRFLLGDENSAQDAKTMLDACSKLMQDYNCSVILVHHTGVSDEAQHRARGSSAWRGALDIEVSVVPSKDNGPIEIVQRKSKDSEMVDPVYVELQSIDIDGWFDEDGAPVSSAILVAGAAPVKVSKADEKLKYAERAFQNMFALGGQIVVSGMPIVKYSAAETWFLQDGKAESTAKSYATNKLKAGVLNLLQDSKLIKKNELQGGWEPTSEVLKSRLLTGIVT